MWRHNAIMLNGWATWHSSLKLSAVLLEQEEAVEYHSNTQSQQGT